MLYYSEIYLIELKVKEFIYRKIRKTILFSDPIASSLTEGSET
jgi:hypothetical protein